MRQALAEERPERLGAATASGANEGLELREAELDGIEVRAIGWQVPEGGPGSLDGALDAGDLVGPEIVGNDDVAGLQGRHQDLFDVGAEALAIDRAVELAGPNPLYQFVSETVGGPGHALGEMIFKIRRYAARRDPEDLLKIAAWAYLVWCFDHPEPDGRESQREDQ